VVSINLVGLDEQAARERLLDGIRRERLKPDSVPFPASSVSKELLQQHRVFPGPSRSIWNVPYLRNDYFTGRQEILEQLHTRFKANNATALSQRHAMSGLGGIGKTQTAVEYAYRYHDEYQAVLWARAESHEALTSSFVEIAALLDLPQKDEQDQTITVQAVKRWLQDNKGWLLILDNADEPKVVREFLPTKFDGHILLTTRAQALGGLAQRIEVDTFTPELGALFLLRRATLIDSDGALELATPEDREVATKISEELGGLPLALDQAGAYIEETSCSLADYLDLYRTRRAEMLKERGGLTGDHPESVATTWSLSFQRVEEKNAAAADLLRLCAFLAPDATPEEIITAGAEHLGPVLQATANDSMALNKAIAALGTYSLIRRDPAEKTLSIHRLVQAVLRDAMADDETKLWAERTVLAVSKACPSVEFETRPQWEQFLPHALACADLVERGDLMLVEAAFLLKQIGSYLKDRARYTEAEPLYARALAIREQQLGSDHPNTATILNNLAGLYCNQGKYEQAEPLYIRALAITEQQLGSDHPDTASTLNNLAELYRNQGKYEQAEPLFLRAFKISEQQLGIEHLKTAISLSNLAVLYYTQGKYEQAEPLFLHAFEIYGQQLGLEHPDMASTLNNLAVLYGNQGKYEQAEPLFLHAFKISEQQLGPDHPDTASTLNNLALFYCNQGKYEQTEPLFLRALKIYEQQLGPDHPDTANSLNNLALLYYNQGKYEQAEPLFLHALKIYEQQLGPDHPNTAISLSNLAVLYYTQGKYEQVEQMYLRALKIYEQQLGPDHPSTAISLNNLAELYRNQGKHEQAEPLYQCALAIFEKALGSQHSNTQQARRNYAALLRAMDRDEEAKQIEEKQ
jgi:tetratricopeptide (TPR) repeat protein